MAQIRTLKTSFTAGELAPELLGRPDLRATANGALRYCYFYHKTAIGHAAAAEISTDITWHGDRAAHFVNTMMSQGAVLVADTGLVRMRCKE